jgi:large subunit ribosomal protein L28
LSKICEICGKGTSFGHTVSHAHNVGQRRWDPNLHTVRAKIEGKTKKISVCTRCLRTGKVVKAK